METKTRSAVKSVIWRIIGIFVLGAVAFFYTRRWMQTSLITFLHHGVFLIVFYVHDRFWLHVDWKAPFDNMLFRSFCKCITYETILGNLILAVITLIVTGDVQTMSKITLTYIFLKHALYIWHEFFWKRRIKWGISKI